MGLLDPTTEAEDTEQKPLAPRVDTLEDACIGLFDSGKPAAEPILAAIEETLSEKYPDATFTHYEFGKNGVNKAKEEEELDRVRDWARNNADAVIAANGDCGSCTKFLSWSTEVIEDEGIPTVGLVDEGFELDFQSNSVERGRPLRYKTTPVRAEVTDPDRIRKKMTPEVIEEIEEELTRPLSEKEKGSTIEA